MPNFLHIAGAQPLQPTGLLVGSNNGRILRIDPSNGALIETFTTSPVFNINSLKTDPDGNIYACGDGQINKKDPAGNNLWSYSISAEEGFNPIATPSMSVDGDGSVIVNSFFDTGTRAGFRKLDSDGNFLFSYNETTDPFLNGTPGAVAFNMDGDILHTYAVDTLGFFLQKRSGSNAHLWTVGTEGSFLATDQNKNAHVAGQGAGLWRRHLPTGAIAASAGIAGNAGALSVSIDFQNNALMTGFADTIDDYFARRIDPSGATTLDLYFASPTAALRDGVTDPNGFLYFVRAPDIVEKRSASGALIWSQNYTVQAPGQLFRVAAAPGDIGSGFWN